MESSISQKPMIQPKTLVEMLPGLGGILTKEAMQNLTAKKATRPPLSMKLTSENTLRPLTYAEMRPDIQAVKVQSVHRAQHVVTTSTMKKPWNSSSKVVKQISHINGRGINTVRKTLFQPQTKQASTTSNPRVATQNNETPKFPKPKMLPKKALTAKTKHRITGASMIPPTPNESAMPNKFRCTLANKENIPRKMDIMNIRRVLHCNKFMPDTTISNDLIKATTDASFLGNEKENHKIGDKTKVLEVDQQLENKSEVLAAISTPFKEYRHVQEYFDNTSDMENSMFNDYTITSFHGSTHRPITQKREESVIVSLCDLLNKATVSNNAQTNNIEYNELIEVVKETEHRINLLNTGIQMLQNIKEAEVKSLRHIKNIIQKNVRTKVSEDAESTTLLKNTPRILKDKVTPVKSPSYKIPQKNKHLRRSICKSMPNVYEGSITPKNIKSNKALNMYMEMKQDMNFLNTPVVKQRVETPDTPALTSQNLQRQLDKLFNGS